MNGIAMSDQETKDVKHFHPETGELIEPTNIFRLSVDEIRALLAQKHNSSIDADDPMLMLVTIFNAALDKAEASQQAKLLAITDEFEKGLAEKLEPITQEALKNQIHSQLAKMHETGKVVESLLRTFRKYTFWLGILGMITIGASLLNIYLMTK